MRLIRVFPRKTKATPTDALARFDPPKSKRARMKDGPRGPITPDIFDEADEVHVSVTFTWDKPKAERLAEQWRAVTSNVKVGGVAYGDRSLEFIPGRYIRPGYTITSRGCPRRCWFCSVWKKWPTPNELPIYDGWNVLDDNLLACSERHVRAVFDMLKRQTQRVCFTGGLEALALQEYQVDLLASLRPKPAMFWAYDDPEHTPDTLESMERAARLMLAAGFTRESHRLRCYVLIGQPQDTIAKAEKRLLDMERIGFTPMAMLWRPETASAMRYEPTPEWRAFQPAVGATADHSRKASHRMSPRLRASHLGLDLQCRFAELPIPQAEYRFHPTRKWRFDFAWPSVRLAVEINGGAFAAAGGRHTRGAGFRSDAEKLAEAAILGWRVIPVLPEQIRSGLALEFVRRALTPPTAATVQGGLYGD